MKYFLLSTLTALLIGGPSAQAGEWEEGYAAYERQDYAGAVKKWRNVADTGNSAAQSILGAMYAQGQGVPQNYPAALKWYRLAAAQGDVKAQYKLGFMYAYGQGTARNMTLAYMWSQIAMTAGHPEAVKIRTMAESELSLEAFEKAKKMVRNCETHRYSGCE